MRFTFKLQSFLNLKSKLEEQAEMEYGKALAVLERCRIELARLEAERDAKVAEFSEKVRGSIDPREFSRYNSYIDTLKRLIIEQIKVVKKAEAIAEQKRLLLVEALRERKTLETLRERELELFRIEEKRQEQRVVDELVSYKYGHKATEDEKGGEDNG